MKTHEANQKITDAAQAKSLLVEGNARYIANALQGKDGYADDRAVLASGQNPFAVVLCCSDSRVAPEIFFDQKLGDIFVVRNAGNVVDDIVLGSIEYAVEHLHSPLVVVCGHSHCGAATAAHEGGNLPPNIQAIADKFAPSIHANSSVDDVIRANVDNMCAEVRKSDIIEHMHAQVVGAYYDIVSGEVTWFDAK